MQLMYPLWDKLWVSGGAMRRSVWDGRQPVREWKDDKDSGRG